MCLVSTSLVHRLEITISSIIYFGTVKNLIYFKIQVVSAIEIYSNDKIKYNKLMKVKMKIFCMQ